MIDRRALTLGLGASLLASRSAVAAGAPADGPVASAEELAAKLPKIMVVGDAKTARGAMIFSHGFGVPPRDYHPLLHAWIDHGFVIAVPTHGDVPGKDGKPPFTGNDGWGVRLLQMQQAAALLPQNLPLVTAGHSYGGLTAIVAAGATPIGPKNYAGPYNLPRVKAVVAFSPPATTATLIEASGWKSLKVPALIQTGDLDYVGRQDKTYEHHLDSWKGAAPGDKYKLVLQGVDHCFGDAICAGWPGPRRTDRLAEATAISLNFLDAYAFDDKAAKARLKADQSDNWPIQLGVR